MKYCKYCIVVNLVLLVVIFLIYAILSPDQASTQADTRQRISLNPQERGYVVAEMHGFLTTVQGITAAISRQQMESVANLAKDSGTTRVAPAPTSLDGKLPPEFKQITISVQRDFDKLANDADQIGDPSTTLRQLSDITAKCVACHASYRLQ